MSSRVGNLQKGSGIVVKLPLVFKPFLESLSAQNGIVSQSQVLAALLDSDLVWVRPPGMRRKPALLSNVLPSLLTGLAWLHLLFFHQDFSPGFVIVIIKLQLS